MRCARQCVSGLSPSTMMMWSPSFAIVKVAFRFSLAKTCMNHRSLIVCALCFLCVLCDFVVVFMRKVLALRALSGPDPGINPGRGICADVGMNCAATKMAKVRSTIIGQNA